MGCQGSGAVCCPSGVFAGVVEVFRLGRFIVDFWGTQGQRVRKAGSWPSQSSGQSVKVGEGKAKTSV